MWYCIQSWRSSRSWRSDGLAQLQICARAPSQLGFSNSECHQFCICCWLHLASLLVGRLYLFLVFPAWHFTLDGTHVEEVIIAKLSSMLYSASGIDPLRWKRGRLEILWLTECPLRYWRCLQWASSVVLHIFLLGSSRFIEYSSNNFGLQVTSLCVAFEVKSSHLFRGDSHQLNEHHCKIVKRRNPPSQISGVVIHCCGFTVSDRIFSWSLDAPVNRVPLEERYELLTIYAGWCREHIEGYALIQLFQFIRFVRYAGLRPWKAVKVELNNELWVVHERELSS